VYGHGVTSEEASAAGRGGGDDAPTMPPGLRRERILRLFREREFLRVADLSAEFGISEVTVRGDLDALAARGRVRRVRGGAVRAAPVVPERPFEQTRAAHAEEKAAIGAAAAAAVSSGETLILDVGSTTTAVARALAARHDLSDVVVFTNGLTIALELELASPRITVVVTGGTLRPLQHSLVNPMGELVLERITARTVFLGCNGVHPEHGVTNVNLPEAEVKRMMLAAAQRRVIVADGSKLGDVALAHLCPVAEIDVLITGASADGGVVRSLRDHGVTVEVAGG
jgi:DeoR family transcriptional regulator, aga operon transcriptional repressor